MIKSVFFSPVRLTEVGIDATGGGGTEDRKFLADSRGKKLLNLQSTFLLTHRLPPVTRSDNHREMQLRRRRGLCADSSILTDAASSGEGAPGTQQQQQRRNPS